MPALGGRREVEEGIQKYCTRNTRKRERELQMEEVYRVYNIPSYTEVLYTTSALGGRREEQEGGPEALRAHSGSPRNTTNTTTTTTTTNNNNNTCNSSSNNSSNNHTRIKHIQ